jgi:hypothetical protein
LLGDALTGRIEVAAHEHCPTPTIAVGWHAEADRFFAEDFLQRSGHAVGDILLLRLEAEEDDAPFGEQRPGLLQALAGVDIVVEAGVGHRGRRV